MGRVAALIRYRVPTRSGLRALPSGLARRRPRAFEEWETLREWGVLPEWEADPPGYLLRAARGRAGLTQAELGERLGVTQQAVARAERWEANPTVAFLRRWAAACEGELEIAIRSRADRGQGRKRR